MNIFSFMASSPFLTFFLAWLVHETVCCMWKRFVRHLNIRRHGWPPAHLDADGDFAKRGDT